MTGSTVTLNVVDGSNITHQTYTLSPGCDISHQIQMDNIRLGLPGAGNLVIDLGITATETVTITGQLTYEHNNSTIADATTHSTSTPLNIMREMVNWAKFRTSAGANKAGTVIGTPITTGKWSLCVDAFPAAPPLYYYAKPYQINYTLASGKGNIVDYTIQLQITDSL